MISYVHFTGQEFVPIYEISDLKNTKRILHECLCVNEFAKRVEEKRLNMMLAMGLINSIIQEQEC